MTAAFDRRSFLRAAGAIGLLAYISPERVRALIAQTARRGTDGRYLRAHELDTLRAVTARLVPGPPDDPDPGAKEARCAEAIDLLLGAFEVHPPLIHAGGPFSNRAGSPRDDFAHFVALDRHAALGWRIRLEGSKGRRRREFAGPVRGLQQIYRQGLRHLDGRARDSYGSDFKDLLGPQQDTLLSDQSDDRTQELVGTAFANTLEALYGPPEYGGNHNLVGWKYTGWAGDAQPRGFTRAEVEKPDTGSVLRASAARRALPYLDALAGRAASSGAPWLARRRLGR